MKTNKAELNWLLLTIVYILFHAVMRASSVTLLITGVLGVVVTGANIMMAVKYYRKKNENKFWNYIVIGGLVAIVVIWDFYKMI